MLESLFGNKTLKELDDVGLSAKMNTFRKVVLADYLVHLTRNNLLPEMNRASNIGTSEHVTNVILKYLINGLDYLEKTKEGAFRSAANESTELRSLKVDLLALIDSRSPASDKLVPMELDESISRDSRVSFHQMMAVVHEVCNREYTMEICLKQIATFKDYEKVMKLALDGMQVAEGRAGGKEIERKAKECIKKAPEAMKETIIGIARRGV